MKGVRSLEWNPTVSNCFATASPDTTVRFWDVGEQKGDVRSSRSWL